MPKSTAAPQVRKLKIGPEQDGQRVDNFLIKTLGGVPKSHVYQLLRSGQVRVNGGRVKPERKLAEGDELRIPPVRMPEKGEAVRPPDAVLKKLRAAVLHSDAGYLVLNKPAGLPVHGGTGQVFGVIEAARVAFPEGAALELCHRLDRETSGVLLLSKSRPALLRAHGAFRDGAAQKRYLTLLCGPWKGGARIVDSALMKNRPKGGERMVLVDEAGKPSRSRFTPIRRFRDATLCEVDIYSGRMHQIRVHAAELGAPVAGDGKYGRRDAVDLPSDAPMREAGLDRMFLHASSLKLPRADNFPELAIEATLPAELAEVLENLAPEGGK